MSALLEKRKSFFSILEIPMKRLLENSKTLSYQIFEHFKISLNGLKIIFLIKRNIKLSLTALEASVADRNRELKARLNCCECSSAYELTAFRVGVSYSTMLWRDILITLDSCIRLAFTHPINYYFNWLYGTTSNLYWLQSLLHSTRLICLNLYN